MDENYILPVGQGAEQVLYQIEKAFILDGKCFFSILNLSDFNVMFGEYLGPFSAGQDPEELRKLIHREFLNGCSRITFADGYMVDELYELWESGML